MDEIKFLKPLNAIPKSELNIYRLRAPQVNELTLMKTARIFDLKGDRRSGRFSKDADKLTYIEGPFEVTLYQRSGALRYSDSTRWQVDKGGNLDITDEEAVKIASKFIKDKNLDTIVEYKLLKVTRLYAGTLELKTNKGENHVIDAAVVFQHNVNNIPVDGPGGKVIVYMDHNKQITGYDRIAREIETVFTKIPASELRSPKFAEEDLIRNWKGSLNGKGRIEVTETRIGYFEHDRGENQLYLQPAYIMPLQLISLDGKVVMKSVHIVPMASKPPVPIIPRLRPKVEQPPRK